MCLRVFVSTFFTRTAQPLPASGGRNVTSLQSRFPPTISPGLNPVAAPKDTEQYIASWCNGKPMALIAEYHFLQNFGSNGGARFPSGAGKPLAMLRSIALRSSGWHDVSNPFALFSLSICIHNFDIWAEL